MRVTTRSAAVCRHHAGGKRITNGNTAKLEKYQAAAIFADHASARKLDGHARAFTTLQYVQPSRA